MANELLKKYDLVIGTDADEFLVLDPDVDESLVSYLSKIDINPSVSGLGVDVGQHLNEEQTIDGSKPFLSQRSYGQVSSRYTKPVVVSKPVRWGAGFHRIKGHNFRIDRNLYLLHFGVSDYEMVKARFRDKDRMAAGWERHMKKTLQSNPPRYKQKSQRCRQILPHSKSSAKHLSSDICSKQTEYGALEVGG